LPARCGQVARTGDIAKKFSYYGSNTCGPIGLAVGATSSPPTALKTSTTNKDRWPVSFIMNGRLYTGHENCGFESADNGGNVVIVLNAEDWNIDMPKSSSCSDNDYDRN
jgi:hypothetical protein